MNLSEPTAVLFAGDLGGVQAGPEGGSRDRTSPFRVVAMVPSAPASQIAQPEML